ncbi:MAG TPA: hypothetical protein DEB35_05755, partial [Desulfuromonas sp.]|nr:hypothetical protein [Desulfuromonas sp.]
MNLAPLYAGVATASPAVSPGPRIFTRIGGESFAPPRPLASEKSKVVESLTPIGPISPISPISLMEKPPVPTAPAPASKPLLTQMQQTLTQQAESH